MPDNSPITLTNGRIAQLSEGLASLDGLRTKPDEFEPYLFNPDTTWIIASNQTILADKIKVFEKAKKSLASQHKITERMAITPENSTQVNAFMEGLSVLQDTEVAVEGLQKISREKLNVGNDKKKGQNTIPASVLAKLMPLLEE